MSTMLINSREVFQSLEKAGFKKEQATAVSKVLEDIDTSSFITKGYLDTKLSELETRIAEVKYDFVRFLFIQTIATSGLVVGLIKLL